MNYKVESRFWGEISTTSDMQMMPPNGKKWRGTKESPDECIGEGSGNHTTVLAWRIPGTVEPGGLPSMGLHRVGHDWSDLAA